MNSMVSKALATLCFILAFSAGGHSQIDPSRDVKWPTGASGCVYAPATNTCVVPSGGGGGGSTTVLYASTISGTHPGVSVSAGSSATGTTDSATALNSAIAGGNIDLEVDSGFALSTSLVLSSNTTIHCTSPQNGFIMQASANAPVIVNAHQNAPTTSSGTGGYLVSNQTDNNIRVIGCMLNANSVQAVTGSGNISGTANTTNPGTGLAVYGATFASVNGLWFEQNELYDSGQYHVAITNSSNVFVDGNYLHVPQPTTAHKNTDGVDILGPDNYVEIDSNIINSGDDAIAIAAEGCIRGGEADCLIPNWKWGPIQHVHVEHNTLQNANTGIRLLDASELLDDIDIGDTQGNTCDTIFVASEYSSLNGYGSGNIGRVNIHGYKVQTSGACNTYSGPYNFVWGLNSQDVEISGVQYANPTVNWPVFTMLGSQGTIQTLNLHDWDITTISSTFSDVIATNGPITYFKFMNNTWNDSVGTGSFISGSTASTYTTCSGYVGRNLFSFGLSGSTYNGDCFATTQTNGTNNTNPQGSNFVPSTVDAAGLHVTPSNPSANEEKFEITGTPSFNITWPPSASGPTFSPSAGTVASGTTVTTSCSGGSPYISSGATAVAGGTGIAVTGTETLYGACQGSGYFTTGSAAYTTTTNVFNVVNDKYFHGTSTPEVNQALPAFSNALTTGSLIVVHQYSNNTTYSVPTDTAGNTYVDCGPGQVIFGSSTSVGQCFYALNTFTTSSNVVTIHTSGSSVAYLSAAAFEITGAASSSPIDGGSGAGYSTKANATGGSAGSNNLTATSLTPAGSGDLIVAFFASQSGATAGTSPNSFTLVNSGWVQSSEYFYQAVSAAITATASDATGSDGYAALVVAIKP